MDFEMKFDLRQIIIQNDFGIVTVLIIKIPSYIYTNSNETLSLKYNPQNNIKISCSLDPIT